MSDLMILMERLTNAKYDLNMLKSMNRHVDHEDDPMGVSAMLMRCMERTKQDMEALEIAIKSYENS